MSRDWVVGSGWPGADTAPKLHCRSGVSVGCARYHSCTRFSEVKTCGGSPDWRQSCSRGTVQVRSGARGSRRIIEVCYLRNPKNLVLCGLLMGMSVSLFACRVALALLRAATRLRVATAPTITQQPASLTVTAGQSATFSVTATGTAPLSYQWYVNSAEAGTNSSSFTIAAATVGQTGAQIYVTVTNAVGSATSAKVTLTVNAATTAPVITQQPANADGDCRAGGGIFGDGDGHVSLDVSMVRERHGERNGFEFFLDRADYYRAKRRPDLCEGEQLGGKRDE